MIPIKRLDHVSMAHADWRTQSAWLERVLGFPFLRSFSSSPSEPFDGCVSLVPATEMEFEVISPVDGSGFVQAFLEANGPGFHHITLEVEDIHVVARELERFGITPFGGIVDDGEWYVTYIHPRDSGGILWQLEQPYRYHKDPAWREPVRGAVDVRRMDHVSMCVADREHQMEWQQRVLGFEVNERWTNERQGYEGANLRIPGSKLLFEIVAPTRDDSFAARFLAKRRPGMHHVCCEVPSVAAAVEGLRAAGIEAYGGVQEHGHYRTTTYIHPRDAGGILIQLFDV